MTNTSKQTGWEPRIPPSDQGDDDRKADRQAKSRKARARVPKVFDGPCCGNCTHWRRPEDGDDYGSCRVLFWLGRPRSERGWIVDLATAQQAWAQGQEAEELATAAGFGCSQFAAEPAGVA